MLFDYTIELKKVFKRHWYLLTCFDLIEFINNKGSNSLKLTFVIIVDITLLLEPYFDTIVDMDRVGFEPTTTYVSSANCMQGRYSTRLNYRPIELM